MRTLRPSPIASALLSCALALSIAGAVAAPAHAQTTEAAEPPPTEADTAARQHHRLATAYYENGDFESAAREFEEAYRLSSRPELLYNLFLAYRDYGDVENAARCLRLYLERAEHPDDPETLHARLTALERQVELRARERAALAPSAPPPSESSPIASSPVGFIVLGVGALAIVGAIITGVLANDLRLSLETRCGPQRDRCPADFEGDRSTGQALSLSADILGIAGGVAAAVGTVLVFVLDGRPPPPVSASCDGNGCALAARGTF